MLINQSYEEKELLIRIADGDEKAFAILYKHYVPLMHPFWVKISGSPTNADEVIQETFLRVWLNRDQLPEINNFRNWLFTVASRQQLQRLRKELRQQEKADRLLARGTVLSEEGSPGTGMEIREIKSLVAEAVNSLSEQRQRIYKLSREKGYTSHQIAAELNLSVQTVHNTLSAALRQIREHLTRSGYNFSLFIYLLLKIF
ncbi:RNA polymerase sigma factor [Pseudobacter ginsenosidimutans]|uniref:RNA polymerase ECF family sigma subunit n=1 Tax=Pseudobacter ginsenosidimutans TaxID=661488 RepID=A0A4Q7N4X4_9BACT|nr:sigma-70 family RNA polymerase sigma factor [Pseudobacter ginsenosidimutans]QEC44606.1 sigma-70 family RNA polymerase sigma factor [Pseudobacter ginsenosidimutans]RZS76085.1 RNA polymerase ECF family sigma subunit [Pseudobacter ginsenosidimutans]